VHCAVDRKLCHRDLYQERQISSDTCGKLRSIFSFIHFSDAQLKEERISMAGDLSEIQYDEIISGVQRHPELEKYDYAALLATVLGMNHLSEVDTSYACPKPSKPNMAIHTGDAIDAGMFSELFEFLAIVGQLEMPFYNVMGNHDRLFFGTFPPEFMQGQHVALPFVPIQSPEQFMRAHFPDYNIYDISIPNMQLDPHEPTNTADGFTPPLPCSWYHGFDLACRGPKGAALCNAAQGYYEITTVIDQDGQETYLRFLVLNTTEVAPESSIEAVLEKQSKGEMRQEQFLWLENELSRYRDKRTIVFVVGHHKLDRFLGDHGKRLREMLLNESKVAAYITGHTHVNAIHAHKRKNGYPLWEIVAGSTLIYPQFALWLDLIENPDDLSEVYLRVQSFRQRLGGKDCGSNACKTELACLACRGRKGAANDWKGDSKYRSEAQAVLEANGILRLSTSYNQHNQQRSN